MFYDVWAMNCFWDSYLHRMFWWVLGGRWEYQPKKLSHGVFFVQKGERNGLMWHFVFCYVFLGILFSAYKVCNRRKKRSKTNTSNLKTNDRNDKFCVTEIKKDLSNPGNFLISSMEIEAQNSPLHNNTSL